jgi:DNA-binding transcriptional ArsR family regulator
VNKDASKYFSGETLVVDSGLILAPQTTRIAFRLDPVRSALTSLHALRNVDELSGLGEWVVNTAASLSPEQRHTMWLIFSMAPLLYSVIPSENEFPNFPTFIDYLAQQDAVDLRNRILNEWVGFCAKFPEKFPADMPTPSRDELLKSLETYRTYMKVLEGHEFDEAFLAETYDLWNAPAEFQAKMVSLMHDMWDNYLAAEWNRVRPMLEESIAAFQKVDFSNMAIQDIVRYVLGRDPRNGGDKLVDATDVIFIPSAHIGPYAFVFGQDKIVRFVYAARLPRNAQYTASSMLTRAELLTRLNALADDARLRILELLTKNEEMCAQDIIERLNLSQSSVSRHLSQLSATGYITERRREVAKCYSLNTDRVVDTLRALTNFLARQ